MSKGKPHIPPRFIHYQSEADGPANVRDIVRPIRQELDITFRCEVKPEFITVVDSDRKFVQVSDSFCLLLGYRSEELIGKP